jgi:regulator of protease activity HflC (stomatin/prohibitin superfamily)
MARQAEAERERRAKVISADGEFQASMKLTEAAHKMATEPVSIQLRFLQTLSEIAAEKHSTLVLPIPLELLRAFDTYASGGPKNQAEPAVPNVNSDTSG